MTKIKKPESIANCFIKFNLTCNYRERLVNSKLADNFDPINNTGMAAIEEIVHLRFIAMVSLNPFGI